MSSIQNTAVSRLHSLLWCVRLPLSATTKPVATRARAAAVRASAGAQSSELVVLLLLSDATRAAPSRRGRSPGRWRARATVLLATRTIRCQGRRTALPAKAKSSIDSHQGENSPRRRRRAICLEEHSAVSERRSGAAIVLAVRLSERRLSAQRCLSARRRLGARRRLEQPRRACQRRGRVVREGGAQRAARGHRRGRAL